MSWAECVSTEQAQWLTNWHKFSTIHERSVQTSLESVSVTFRNIVGYLEPCK